MAMEIKDIRLSKTTTVMFSEILEEMREHEFKTVNFPLLLSGLIDARDEDDPNGAGSPLENYLFSLDKMPEEIYDSIDMLITDLKAKQGVEEAKKEEANKENEDKEANKEASEPTTPVAKETTSHVIPVRKNRSKEDLEKAQNPEALDDDVPVYLTFTDYEGNEVKFPADEDIVKVSEKLTEIIEKFSVTEIEPLHFTVALFMADIKEFRNFFKEIYENYGDARAFFKAERILKLGCIPFALSAFLSIKNDEIDVTRPCEILKRDKETETLWNIMLKKNKRNAVIVGEAGVGKTALVEKVTYEIKNGTAPKEFENFKVITLDVNSLIAGTSYRGDAEERIKDIIEFLQNNKDVILFIDEVHTILGAGSCFEGEMDLANALKPILARGETIVIGATTNEEYEKYFSKDAALSRRFEKVEVKEPMARDVYPMIKNKINVLSQFHGVKIKKAMVEYAIMIAGCFAFEKKNPDKTLDLIDRAMVSAKRAGKKWVDKQAILKNFAIFFKLWNNMSEDSKKEVAYHEAGHYIVGKASGRLTANNWLAVSIMPAEDYLGVTVWEYDETKIPFRDSKYFIDEIACDLAGRVSEERFRKTYTSGACQDLENATTTAYTMITKYGMGNDKIKNRIYVNFCDNPMFSEKSIEVINKEIDKIIEKAYRRAERILERNRDILEAIVNALMEKHIMSEAELDKIWKEVVAARTPEYLESMTDEKDDFVLEKSKKKVKVKKDKKSDDDDHDDDDDD